MIWMKLILRKLHIISLYYFRKVYIIGGLVDHNRLKDITINKAL
jgi:hypothetical protein